MARPRGPRPPGGAPAAKALLSPLHGASAEPAEGFTAVGRVVKPHGIRGEFKAAAFAAGAPNMQPGRSVHIGGQRLKLITRREDKGMWVLRLEGFNDRETVERFRGQLIEVEDATIGRADPESYFLHELIGLRVVTADGEELGRVAEVLQPGANDVYVVSGSRGELLIPAIDQVVSSIDLTVGVMTITPIAGLLDKPK